MSRQFRKDWVSWTLGIFVVWTPLVGASIGEEQILQELLRPRIIVKFVEGLEIRLSDGRITGTLSSRCKPKTIPGEKRLDQFTIDQGAQTFNALLKGPAVVGIDPVFSNEARGLQPEGGCPEERDLRLYYSLALKVLPPEDVDRLIEKLNLLKIVETAYRAPVPEDAGLPIQTPDPP